jgi:hypothetical protein
MPKTFKIHDPVSWNSEAGRVRGEITRVHTREFEVIATFTMRAPTFRNTKSRATRPTMSPSTGVPRSPGLASVALSGAPDDGKRLAGCACAIVGRAAPCKT